jgi:cation:H+ antiporter
MNDYLAFALGLVCAGAGGELFVRGTVGMATAARISPGIIAATVAAFATSSPELTIAISSSLAGTPEISLGNALGGNMMTIALILGLAVLISAINVPTEAAKRDVPIAMLVPVTIGVLLLDGRITRVEGWILLAGFCVWLSLMVKEARTQRSAAAGLLGERNPLYAVLESAAGLGLLVAAGNLIVSGGSAMAYQFGLSDFVVGATIVALGTSAPELATVLISKLRGQDEVGIGAIVGSNIFNGLFVIGVAAAITPININLKSAAPALAFGLVALVLVYPPRTRTILRWRGAMLLAAYAIYVAVILQLGDAGY